MPTTKQVLEIQRPNIFQDFYQKKVSEDKPKMIALIATTHKIAKVVYAVWKTNTPYNPNHTQTCKTKKKV